MPWKSLTRNPRTENMYCGKVSDDTHVRSSVSRIEMSEHQPGPRSKDHLPDIGLWLEEVLVCYFQEAEYSLLIKHASCLRGSFHSNILVLLLDTIYISGIDGSYNQYTCRIEKRSPSVMSHAALGRYHGKQVPKQTPSTCLASDIVRPYPVDWA
jgi:hypothetical protein